jgi:type I restriction enzyme M protein
MLTQEIKRKIDSARDILVGKVPDPKAQVEQITTALIYKFMDDMDKESVSLPKGKARFFTNGYEKYAWNKLMDPKVGGYERLNLYVEAITRMSQNPHLPQLFREIFKDAFLPYRDPETLNLFLKEINGFDYDNSENLGDAYEYLLSILGSQGEAGQFRTPRHIIDFIVEVVDPKNDESILDPACGTAGFLISAYKHILNSNKDRPLTPDEKKRLMMNLVGYDISPDMVRISLVNMYLHGFPNPNIYEYDTLTNEERWDDRFDVIMANPPFMTPKGGIRPHKRFAIQAKRSEVLFVDYIIEHLNIKGRAGLIVPEGILTNEGLQYYKLRKYLIENGLFAIVSLPVGVFQPYSATIKTSILFIDRKTINKTQQILFYGVNNDGLDLGRQRNPILENDLPDAEKIIKDYYRNIFESSSKKIEATNIKIVSKTKIIDRKDHILLPDRYLIESKNSALYPICDLFEVEKGTLQSTKNIEGPYEFITASEKWKKHNSYSHDCEAIIFAMGASGSLGRTHYVNGKFIASDLCFILTPKKILDKPVSTKYYHIYFSLIRETIVNNLVKGAAKKAINAKDFKQYKIPYIKYESQMRIVEKVAEMDSLIEKEMNEIQKHENIVDKYKTKIRKTVLSEE